MGATPLVVKKDYGATIAATGRFINGARVEVIPAAKSSLISDAGARGDEVTGISIDPNNKKMPWAFRFKGNRRFEEVL
jgi:hypothetical protein